MYNGVILQPGYRVRQGRTLIQLHGRLESGRPFLVEDDRFEPYLFVRRSDAGILAGEAEIRLRETELHTFARESVSRVFASLPDTLIRLREKLRDRGIPTYEGDIRPPYRYLMDLALRNTISIGGRPENRGGSVIRFRNPELSPSDVEMELTHLSLDLETTADASTIYSAALAGCGSEEVHIVATPGIPAAGMKNVHIHDDERALIIALAARIRELDPDLLLGWNVVDFDLRVLSERARAHRLDLAESSLGRLPGATSFEGDRGFMRSPRARIPGRMVLDGIPLVRDALKLPDYRLETVAHAVLGRGKLIDQTLPDTAEEITRLYLEDPAALAAYNLEDARLVNEILEHEGLLSLARERSRLTGMQLDRVGASIASFDLVYLPELRRHGVVAPTAEPDRASATVRGGVVLEPTPGLARRVAIYDFKSLYPSLMRTFNIDPLALARGRLEAPGASIVAPNLAHLSRDEAILPRVLQRFMERREAARKRGDRHGDQAIKIMMNSMFGIFAAPACRFFSPELANAITAFGQQTLAWTCEYFESEGLSVLYGDTDSVFVQLPRDGSNAEALKRAEDLRIQVAENIAKRIRTEYDVEAQLDLELEKIYSRFFLPRTRGGKGGSKKRYAGWIGEAEAGQLEIVGLESVRRDWPGIAKRLQEGMLERLFRDEELLPFVKNMIVDVRSGELDHELVYTKRIRKGSLDRYTASSPPHVQAARKFEERQGRRARSVIHYLITEDGPEPLEGFNHARMKIDRKHYVEKVLRPVAETILCEVGSSFSEALGEPQQLDLI